MRKKKYGQWILTDPTPIRLCDPCYYPDRYDNAHCCLTLPAGTWSCYLWTQLKHSTDHKGSPVDYRLPGVLGIYLNGNIPFQGQMKSVYDIPVDSGLAGFFRQFSYDSHDQTSWEKFVRRVPLKNYGVLCNQKFFLSCTAEGDGCYDVSVAKDPETQQLIAAEIRFL